MAGSPAARSAQALLKAAPDQRVDEAGKYFVEANDVLDEVERVSPFANRIIGGIVSQKPYSKSDPEPLTYATMLGYCLRIAASRRGVPAPPAAELGADLMPRSPTGEVDYETLYADDESSQEIRNQVWRKVQHQMEQTDIYGVDFPMWKFIVAAVTITADGVGKVGRQLTLDNMLYLLSLGYVMAMLDEASGWDYTIPAPAEPA